MLKFAFWLIWISAIVGGIALFFFLLSAIFVNHANLWLPVLVFSPFVVLIALIGVLVGAVIRIIVRSRK